MAVRVPSPAALQASAAVPCGFLLFVVAWVSGCENSQGAWLAHLTRSHPARVGLSSKLCACTRSPPAARQVILIVIAFGFPFAPGYSAAAVGVFSAMPWALLAKGVQDLADASTGAGGCVLAWARGRAAREGCHGCMCLCCACCAEAGCV